MNDYFDFSAPVPQVSSLNYSAPPALSVGPNSGDSAGFDGTKVQQVFDKIDTDHNGFITRSELKSYEKKNGKLEGHSVDVSRIERFVYPPPERG